MTKPIRVQRQRVKGWKAPPNTIYVGRGTRYGNPFKVGQIGVLEFEPMTDDELMRFDFSERVEVINGRRMTVKPMPPNRIVLFEAPLTLEDVILRYHKHLLDRKIDLTPLRGKNLMCWCRLDQACHADILLELANRPSPPSEEEE